MVRDKDAFKSGYEPRNGWPFASPYDDGAEVVKMAPKHVLEEAKRLMQSHPGKKIPLEEKTNDTSI